MFTGQEFDHETSLYNYRARLYDPVLKRFLDTDPAGQGFTPYAYAGNSPVIFVDPDGEFPWLFVGALALGAGLNVASNWDAITQNGFDFGKFVASAAVGAGSAALNFLGPPGWAAGGFVSGFGNTLIQNGNIGDAMLFGATGSVTGLASGYAGRFVDNHITSPIIDQLNINSPVVNGAIGGALGGALTEGTIGGFWSLAHNGDFGEGFEKGAIRGGLLGATTGSISAGLAAHEAGYHPLTGKSYPNVVRKEFTPELVPIKNGNVEGQLSNAQLVQKAATKAEASVGGTGRFAGTAKHTYASDLLRRYQSVYGDRGLELNYYFNNNATLGSGNRGFLDVLDTRFKIIYDFKFGNATWGSGQLYKYQRNFPNHSLQIIRP